MVEWFPELVDWNYLANDTEVPATSKTNLPVSRRTMGDGSGVAAEREIPD